MQPKITLGNFEEQVLMAIYYGGNDVYGLQITESIEEATGSEVSAGAVYATLDRLAAKGMVTFRYGSLETETQKPKKIFSITNGGKEALRNMDRIRARLTHLRGMPI